MTLRIVRHPPSTSRHSLFASHFAWAMLLRYRGRKLVGITVLDASKR
ncbi:MAG: hypothetical protein RRB24_05575 [Armatimonadota bacterium]|nr:hypothetical protein [Armatimonadota bacterium]